MKKGRLESLVCVDAQLGPGMQCQRLNSWLYLAWEGAAGDVAERGQQ